MVLIVVIVVIEVILLQVIVLVLLVGFDSESEKSAIENMRVQLKNV